VPLNSQAPLTLPGTRSTAGHVLQSSMVRSYAARRVAARAAVPGPDRREGVDERPPPLPLPHFVGAGVDRASRGLMRAVC
jgi:hypothetical protein